MIRNMKKMFKWLQEAPGYTQHLFIHLNNN